MTADPISPGLSRFQATITEAHRQAREVLSGGGAPMDAVVWLSGHLAAVALVVEPVAERVADRETARRQHISLHDLERLLRVAERRHSGDVLASALDSDRLRDALLRAIDSHERAESALLTAIESALPAPEVERLATSYRRALEHAPTRPHPHAPHHGVLGAIAFRVDALRDRVMDTMDSRHVPLPRTPHSPPASGRWGNYLLGQMHSDE